MRFYLIRHAQSEGNTRPAYIQGQAPQVPLSALGREQARLLGIRLRLQGIQPVRWYTSTALRAIQTAQIALPVGTPLYPSDQLLELAQGRWEGCLRDEVYTPEVRARIGADNWNFHAPGGESQRQLEHRMLDFVYSLIDELPDEAEVGIFSHAFSIKCLVRGVLQSAPQATYNMGLHNTSVTQLSYTQRGWHLDYLNDYAHLWLPLPS